MPVAIAQLVRLILPSTRPIMTIPSSAVLRCWASGSDVKPLTPAPIHDGGAALESRGTFRAAGRETLSGPRRVSTYFAFRPSAQLFWSSLGRSSLTVPCASGERLPLRCPFRTLGRRAVRCLRAWSYYADTVPIEANASGVLPLLERSGPVVTDRESTQHSREGPFPSAACRREPVARGDVLAAPFVLYFRPWRG